MKNLSIGKIVKTVLDLIFYFLMSFGIMVIVSGALSLFLTTLTSVELTIVVITASLIAINKVLRG